MSVRQPHTSLSYCEAKVHTINECKKMIQNIQHVLSDLSHIELSKLTEWYINNHARVDWSKSPKTKVMKHLNLHEDHIRYCVQKTI